MAISMQCAGGEARASIRQLVFAGHIGRPLNEKVV